MATTTAPLSLTELALGQLPYAVLIVDDKRKILRANAAACDLLRSNIAELKGSDLTEVIRSEDTTWWSTDPVDRLGTPTVGRKLKARVKGALRNLRVGVYPLVHNEVGAGTMVTVRDGRITDRDPHEEKDHLTSLGELSACVAHEIRNPLTGIRTTVQFVDSKLEENDPRHEDLQEVIKEIDRIEKIIGNLLLFARPVEGTRTLADLNSVLSRVLDSMAGRFSEVDAEVEVKRNFSSDLPEFRFSPDNLQQVVLNLIRNSLEAMPEGGKLKITTTLRRFRSGRTSAAEIFVSDTGHGIPEDLLGNIFKPFFTTRHNGTGLGLPISASIIRAHGGRIYAHNRATGGATFRISLPLKVEEASDA